MYEIFAPRGPYARWGAELQGSREFAEHVLNCPELLELNILNQAPLQEFFQAPLQAAFPPVSSKNVFILALLVRL